MLKPGDLKDPFCPCQAILSLRHSCLLKRNTLSTSAWCWCASSWSRCSTSSAPFWSFCSSFYTSSGFPPEATVPSRSNQAVVCTSYQPAIPPYSWYSAPVFQFHPLCLLLPGCSLCGLEAPTRKGPTGKSCLPSGPDMGVCVLLWDDLLRWLLCWDPVASGIGCAARWKSSW